MKILKMAVVGLFCLSLSSCFVSEFIQEDLVDLAGQHIQNMQAFKEISTNLKDDWEFYSGILDGIEDLLSGEALGIKRELDELYASEDWTDRAAGKALALRARLLKELGQDLVNEALPGFLELF